MIFWFLFLDSWNNILLLFLSPLLRPPSLHTAFNDVPEIFNVSLMEGVDNPFAVHSSKAVGEPPFFLGSCVFYAIKDAIRSARKNQNVEEKYFEMRMPATSERIRMYCNDPIAIQAKQEMFGTDTDRRQLASSYQPQGSY